MKAYVSNTYWRYLYSGTFKAAHLFFRYLYFDFDPRDVRWSIADRTLREELHGREWPANVPAIGMPEPYLWHFALKHYYVYDPKTLTLARRRTGYVRKLDEHSGFFSDFLDPVQGSRHVPSPLLLERCFEWLKTRKSEDRIDHQDLTDLVDMYRELFLAEFLWRRYGILTVHMSGALSLRQWLLNRSDEELWGDEAAQRWRSHVSARTIHELLGKPVRRVEVSAMSEILVPDIEQIPMDSLMAFIARDKPQSIYEMVDRLVHKYRGSLSHQDIAGEVAKALFAVAKVLWPSVGDIAIGLLGNVPSPFLVNPIGAAGLAKSLHVKDKVEREYPWVLAINDVNSLAPGKKKSSNAAA